MAQVLKVVISSSSGDVTRTISINDPKPSLALSTVKGAFQDAMDNMVLMLTSRQVSEKVKEAYYEEVVRTPLE